MYTKEQVIAFLDKLGGALYYVGNWHYYCGDYGKFNHEKFHNAIIDGKDINNSMSDFLEEEE